MPPRPAALRVDFSRSCSRTTGATSNVRELLRSGPPGPADVDDQHRDGDPDGFGPPPGRSRRGRAHPHEGLGRHDGRPGRLRRVGHAGQLERLDDRADPSTPALPGPEARRLVSELDTLRDLARHQPALQSLGQRSPRGQLCGERGHSAVVLDRQPDHGHLGPRGRRQFPHVVGLLRVLRGGLLLRAALDDVATRRLRRRPALRVLPLRRVRGHRPHPHDVRGLGPLHLHRPRRDPRAAALLPPSPRPGPGPPGRRAVLHLQRNARLDRHHGGDRRHPCRPLQPAERPRSSRPRPSRRRHRARHRRRPARLPDPLLTVRAAALHPDHRPRLPGGPPEPRAPHAESADRAPCEPLPSPVISPATGRRTARTSAFLSWCCWFPPPSSVAVPRSSSSRFWPRAAPFCFRSGRHCSWTTTTSTPSTCRERSCTTFRCSRER